MTSGLRERKKRERRLEILESAGQLFGKKGFAGTSMEEIAAAADISPGTVYNFFPTKMDILIELRLAEIKSEVAERLSRAKRLPKDPAQGLLALISMQLDVLKGQPKEDLKRLTAQAILDGLRTPTGVAYAAADAFFKQGMRERLSAYRDAGALTKSASLDVLADLIFSACNGLFFDWIANDQADEERLLARMTQFLKWILRTTTV